MTGLERLTVAFFQAKYLIPFLALLFFIVPQVVTREFHVGASFLAFLVAALGYFSVWRYQRRPESVRALICMHDGFALSIAPVLVLGISNMAYVFSTNFWLYRDYYQIYLLAFTAIFLYVMLVPRKYLGKVKDQMETLATYVNSGITGPELYDVLTKATGAKEALQHWGPQRFALIFGPISIAFVGIGALGGRDYILYFAFLLAIPSAALLMGLSFRRRIYLWKYLGTHDVLIRPG